MKAGKIARIEELTRCAPEVQDAMISLLSEKVVAIPELGETAVRARPGFNVIGTANLRDRGVHDMSSALKRRFNFETVQPIADARFEKTLVATQVAERMAEHAIMAEVGDDVLDLVVSVFRDLRTGTTADGASVAVPDAVMSTAEAVNVTHAAALEAAYLDNGKLTGTHIARQLRGCGVQGRSRGCPQAASLCGSHCATARAILAGVERISTNRPRRMGVTAEADFAGVGEALFQPERGLYFAPIRHHSPACAWAVRAMIREVKPTTVVIEAPVDFEDKIPLVLDADTKPPVALVAMVAVEDTKRRSAAYYPFCTHSPEYVAMQEAQALGAAIRFMDLPSADKAMTGRVERGKPVSLADDRHFDANDYIRALCDKTLCRDGYELWDHLFEGRLGEDGWRGFFRDVGIYCAGLRAATPEQEIEASGDAAREAHMAHVLGGALNADGPVVVVLGGFHTPALTGTLDVAAPKIGMETADGYLIRYGFRALDALNGYGAGLPQPGYYDRIWQVEDRDAVAGDLISGFAAEMRRKGHSVSVPLQVEALRVATQLAALRGRSRPGRHDLFDGIRAAWTKGESGGRDAWSERLAKYLGGTALGDIPASAGSPPLVEDIRARARSLRIDVSDGAERRRKLDIRRKPTHLAASRLFHALDLLEVPFARREAGPDFINNQRTDLLFEEWSHAWSPSTEARMIELSVHGDTLPSACIGHLMAARDALEEDGKGRDLPELFDKMLKAFWRVWWLRWGRIYPCWARISRVMAASPPSRGGCGCWSISLPPRGPWHRASRSRWTI